MRASPPAPPVKESTWEWYIPIYLWSGGISAGSWLAATAEDFAGEGDPDLIRAARYVAAGGVALGTVLLVVDLGRPDRFLNMLRIVRPRSTMSLGSWGLTAFGACSGAAALLQALDDGVLGRRAVFTRLSRGPGSRAMHALGLLPALFVGSYTGVLLGTTNAPSWARRVRLLGPLFIASGVSAGLSAVSLALVAGGRGGGRRRRRKAGEGAGARRRLARAEFAALAAELGLALLNRRRVRALPSGRAEGLARRTAHALTLGAGMAVPLAAQLWSSMSGERSRVTTPAALLTLAGGLALRFLTVAEGKRSARTPDDTWAFTGGRPGARAGAGLAVRAGLAAETGAGAGAGAGADGERGDGRGALRGRKRRPRIARGELQGVITIVQEDRIRVMDRAGRGYLLTVRKGRARQRDLERWRDERVPVVLRYRGTPEVHARVYEIAPRRGCCVTHPVTVY